MTKSWGNVNMTAHYPTYKEKAALLHFITISTCVMKKKGYCEIILVWLMPASVNF